MRERELVPRQLVRGEPSQLGEVVGRTRCAARACPTNELFGTDDDEAADFRRAAQPVLAVAIEPNGDTHAEELDELFAAYEDDDAAAFGYTKALAAFRRHGDSAQARRLLAEARELNPHVPAYLSGRKRLPVRLPDYVGFGDANEAVDYAASAKALWASVPGALAWLGA